MPDECRDVLLKQNLSVMKRDRNSRLFISNLIDQSFYDQNKMDIMANYGDAAASFGSFSESRSTLKSHYQYSLSSSESLSAASMFMPAGAIEAWSLCMEGKKSGLFGWIEGGPSDPNFMLWLQWAPPLGMGGTKLKNITGTISIGSGPIKKFSALPNELLEGKKVIQISRDGNNSVRGTVSGQANGIEFPIAFFAPFFPAPVGLIYDPFFLSHHPETLIKRENVHGDIHFGTVYWQPEAWVGNVNYTGNCICLHPPSHRVATADFSIPVGAKYFSSIVGFSRQDSRDGYGKATARVYVDGEWQWSGHLEGLCNNGQVVTETHKIGIPDGARVLRLASDSNGDNGSDHVTWCRPQFTATL